MASWEEVKRLAADFQKVQLSSTTQKLSERNCIEIVSWLLDRKLVDLIFTSDGKEYLTPAQLVHDIKGELYVNGGRVNFVELAKSIGVDLHHITTHINEVIRGQKDIHSVLGQLIDSTYITKIAAEINEKLQQQGQINLSDLTIQYDLPAEFLQQNVFEKYLGKIIHGEQDKNDSKVYFTQSFIARSKAKIKGALVGLTKPTPVSTILSIVGISDKLYFSLFDQTSTYGFLTSRVSGALYVPNVYSRSQNEWVSNFYKQNSYLEFDALTRLGISDHKSYIKKHFANEEIIHLKSCIISKGIIEQTEAYVDQSIRIESFIDVQLNLPSILTEADIKLIMDIVLKSHNPKQFIVIDNHIITTAFLNSVAKSCDILVQERAELAVKSGKYQQFLTDTQISTNKSLKGDADVENFKVDKREERRKKAAGGKSGGGTQGRETKTKSTKRLYRSVKNMNDDDEDYEVPKKKITFEIITVDDVRDLTREELEDNTLEELVDDIVNYMQPSINENALEIAAEIYAATVSDHTATRRLTHNDVQSKLNVLLGDIRLFEKGLKLLPSDTQPQLYKYLLKTLCTDIVNEILNYISSEKGMSIVADNFTNEQRLKFVNDLSSEYKPSLLVLLKTLGAQSVEDFMAAAEKCLTACSMILKKIDKKKDKIVISNHKHGLIDQLEKCDDPALVLHLSSLIIFIGATQNILHASGRHVASILAFLKPSLTPEQSAELTSYHDLVTLMLSGGSEAENAKDQLKDKISVIRTIATEYKKATPEKS